MTKSKAPAKVIKIKDFEIKKIEKDVLRARHLGMTYKEFIARKELLRKQYETLV